MGYKIGKNHARPCVDRARGIISYERPKNKRGLQRFLNSINFERMFVKNITELTKPLYKLTQKEEKFIWTDKDYDFFKKKNKWKEAIELYIPDGDKEFELEADASNIGLGASLRQEDQPVAYVNDAYQKKKLTTVLQKKKC